MEQLQTTDHASADETVLVAIELSKMTWLLAGYDPCTSKISRRRVDGGDADALISVLERCQRSGSSACSRPAMTGFGYTAALLRLGSPAG